MEVVILVMPTILLIRHGESQSNAGEPTPCPHTVELTDKGWKQAEAIAQFLQDAKLFPDLIVTSSYWRTKQTAEPTKLAFPSIPEEEWPIKEFTYLSMWHYENSTIEDRRPLVEGYWEIADPELVDNTKPGSPEPESFTQFIRRVRNVKKRLENTETGIIAIFTHEQFIFAFKWLSQHHLDAPSSENMTEFRASLKANPIPNGAIVQAKFHKEYDEWHFEVIKSHLENPLPVFAN